MNERTNMPVGGAGAAPGHAHDPKPSAEDAARRTSESAAKGGDDVRQTADRVKETATATAQEVGDRVKEQAKGAGDKLKEQSRNFINEQKGRVGAEIQTYSEAARQAAERLKGESDTNLAQYVTTAADRLDQLGGAIKDRDLGQLMNDTEDMARRRPEVFFGGMFVAGLAIARFLKASKKRRQGEGYNSDYQLALRRPNPGMTGGSARSTPGAARPGAARPGAGSMNMPTTGSGTGASTPGSIGRSTGAAGGQTGAGTGGGTI